MKYPTTDARVRPHHCRPTRRSLLAAGGALLASPAIDHVHLTGSIETHDAVVWGPPGGKTSAHGAHMVKARIGHHLCPRTLSSGRDVFDELESGRYVGRAVITDFGT